MKTLTTNEVLKTLFSEGDDVRVFDGTGNLSDLKVDIYREDGLSWIISREKQFVDYKEKRAGRVFAAAAYEVDENGRCTGRSMIATMTPVRLADIFHTGLLNALKAAELAR